MKVISDIFAWLFYVAIRSAIAVLQIFPLEWNLRTARLVARVWGRWISSRHLDRAKKHLEETIGGQFSPERLHEVALQSLESLTMFVVETICLPRLIGPYTWSRYIRLKGFDDALRALMDGKGVILVTGHYGPFELTGHLLAVLNFDVVAVMRPLDNRHLNGFLVRTRRTHGLTLLDKKGAMDEAQEVLQRGAALAFIGDQDAGRKGLFVDFFNRPASTYKSIGLLAMASNVPVVVGYARRLGNRAKYEVGVNRVVYPHEWEGRDDPLRWLTQEYTSAIEEAVREDLGQYLWLHRRWKSQPKKRRTKKTPGAERAVSMPATGGAHRG